MKKPHRYIDINGTWTGVDEENRIIGYITTPKTSVRARKGTLEASVEFNGLWVSPRVRTSI